MVVAELAELVGEELCAEITGWTPRRVRDAVRDSKPSPSGIPAADVPTADPDSDTRIVVIRVGGLRPTRRSSCSRSDRTRKADSGESRTHAQSKSRSSKSSQSSSASRSSTQPSQHSELPQTGQGPASFQEIVSSPAYITTSVRSFGAARSARYAA